MSQESQAFPQFPDYLLVVAEQFAAAGEVTSIEEFGSGNINATFLVISDSPEAGSFILQRLNTQVFRQPESVMGNLRTLSEHVRQRLSGLPSNGDRPWEVPQVLAAQDGKDYWRDAEGSFWRALSWIGGCHSRETIQDLEQGREVGRALGTFHALVSDLPAESLIDTLEGFHVTPNYLGYYDRLLAEKSPPPSPEVAYCLQFVAKRRHWAGVLEAAKAEGKLFLRPIHGDPKVNNVLLDAVTGQAVSLVDLDTVKPGLVHYDIGDCLRSGCNLLGEETEQWQAVCFDSDLCQAILQGYLPLARQFLTSEDYDYLYDAIRLLAFELGLRFFTDYLAGNVYFKVRHSEHNLARALVQFKLTESIESQATAIGAILEDLR